MKIVDFLRTIDGLSANTKRSYEQTLWQLNHVIKGDEPTDEEIYAFLKPYVANSLHRHKAAIKAYFEWQKRDWPFNRRQFAQRRRAVPRYVDPGLVKVIAEAGDKDDYMFVWTLFQLGCRINELMEIEDQNVNPGGVLMVTKGGDQNLTPITKEFYQELKKYTNKKKGRIFPRTYTYYNNRLKVLAREVGHDDITPHMLRHARAVDLLNKGMDLSFIQQFLHHANISTTAIYTLVTTPVLATQLERAENGHGRRPLFIPGHAENGEDSGDLSV